MERNLNECLKILNVDKNATIHDIKRAYRKLVKKYHPDIAGNEKYYVEKFREITKAYKTLIDAINSHEGELTFETTKENSLREFFRKKFRIRNYIELFKARKKPKKQEYKVKEIFLKKVSDEILILPEEELILRLEGSSNFYVILEAVKALYKKNSETSLLAIITNFYKYQDDLKDFVVLILKRKINEENFYKKCDYLLKKGSYNVVVSIIGFLSKLENKNSKKILKEFINNHLGFFENLKVIFETLKIKLLSSKELKLGEKLIQMEKISSFQLLLALSIKERFNQIKIGKILIDTGFIKSEDLKKALSK